LDNTLQITYPYPARLIHFIPEAPEK
jgi:hypothetical protein